MLWFMNMTIINNNVIKSYHETNYHVYSEPAFFLTTGKPSQELLKLHDKYHVDCSAFITAFNPYSCQANEQQNIEKNLELSRFLSEMGFKLVEGVGQHPSNQWPGEPSFLVLGIPLDTAKHIGMQFEQNAILWSDSDAIPRLELLR